MGRVGAAASEEGVLWEDILNEMMIEGFVVSYWWFVDRGERSSRLF